MCETRWRQAQQGRAAAGGVALPRACGPVRGHRGPTLPERGAGPSAARRGSLPAPTRRPPDRQRCRWLARVPCRTGAEDGAGGGQAGVALLGQAEVGYLGDCRLLQRGGSVSDGAPGPVAHASGSSSFVPLPSIISGPRAPCAPSRPGTGRSAG
jgi:hypothetical protein